MSQNLATDHSQAKLVGAHSHGGQRYVSSRADRKTSFDLADFPIPSKEEEWRFTPRKRFAPLFDLEAVSAAADQVKVATNQVEGISVQNVERTDERLGQVGQPGDRASAVAWNAFSQATLVTIDAGAQPKEALVVEITGQAKDTDDAAAHPSAGHLRIIAETGSKATVVLSHKGMAYYTQGVEVSVAPDAELTLVTSQEWDDHALHRPYVAHTEPHCYSRVTYKGALQGKDAHAVWVGDCLIGRRARGTDTYELNRNLVLTTGAKADSVPNLEIENGQIEGAGHASATGRFDDEQLFYLRARGIPEIEARRLVVLGFFNEIVAEIAVPEVEERLMSAIEAELEVNGLLEA